MMRIRITFIVMQKRMGGFERMKMYMVRRLKGVNDPHDDYFDTLVEARIFQNHNGGSIWRRITSEYVDEYWARVKEV